MRTICPGCGATLTNEAGERLQSGNFTDNLPNPTDDVTYAWCDTCEQNAPTNPERYRRMMTMLTKAESKDELERLSTLYIFDESYPREDIARALHAVECERGWHA